MGRVIQWHKDGMIIDTWAMHIDPGPSDALARRMAQEILNRPWLTAVPYMEDMEKKIAAIIWGSSTRDADELAKRIMAVVRGET